MIEMTLRIYHYKRCSKSRQALSFLESIGEVSVIDYHLHPPQREELEDLMQRSIHPPHEFIRLNDEIPLDSNSSQDAIIEYLMIHPRVLQRPLVDDGSAVVIGRPLENLQHLPALSRHFPR